MEENTSLMVGVNHSTGVAKIFETAATIEELKKVGQFIIESGFAPDHFKNQSNPAAAVIMAMQSGTELGFTLLQSLHEIVVINGLPTIKGDAAKAKVMGSGLVESWKEEITGTIEGNDYKVKITSKRKYTGEEISREFSVADAIRAGLWITPEAVKKNYKLGYGPWYKFPKRMIGYRALGFLTRDLYPDVLKGFKTAEEAEDYTNAIDVTPTEAAKQKSSSVVSEAMDAMPDKKKPSKKKKEVEAEEAEIVVEELMEKVQEIKENITPVDQEQPVEERPKPKKKAPPKKKKLPKSITDVLGKIGIEEGDVRPSPDMVALNRVIYKEGYDKKEISTAIDSLEMALTYPDRESLYKFGSVEEIEKVLLNCTK